MDLQICVDWCRGESTISDEVWESVDENEALSVPESEVSVPVEQWIQIGRTWGGVSEVLGTWDDKLSKFLEKESIQIRSDLVKL
jgi:hypothetical protein